MMNSALHLLRSFGLTMVVLGTCSLLSGCSGGGFSSQSPVGQATFTEIGGGPTAKSEAPIGGKAAAAAQKIFAANSPGSDSSGGGQDYRISSLDVIDISVFGVKDLSRTVQVSSSGQITLPLVGTVKVGGKTTSQVESEIAKRLQASYLQSPQVSVFVKEFNSQKITVDGAVTKPGIFPITTGNVTLLQAIALAEGLNRVADPSAILVFRTIGGRHLAARYDLHKVRSGATHDPELLAGDIVMVDESAARTTLRDLGDAIPLGGVFRMLAL